MEDGDELVSSGSVSLTSLVSGLTGTISSSLGVLLTSFSISAISANCSIVFLRCSLPLEILIGGAHSGKCFGKGTEIVMADGRLKRIEDIKKDDCVMGIDSKPRKVLGNYRDWETV